MIKIRRQRTSYFKGRKFYKKNEMESVTIPWKVKWSVKKNYGFNFRKCSPSVGELTDFEDGMTTLIKIMEYRNMNSKFQSMVSPDIRKIAADYHVLVPADKSKNIC